MPHNIDLVTTVAVSLGLAMILGYLATRMKLPPIVGYLLAGILTALPLGWFLRSQGVALSGGSYAPFYFWLTLVGWSVGALLITLPCWLDKLRDGPGRVVPVAGAFK